jgi:hypothetical protein
MVVAYGSTSQETWLDPGYIQKGEQKESSF